MRRPQKLAQVALALEEYYAEPPDVEWALDSRTGRMVVLQTAPCMQLMPPQKTALTRRMPRSRARSVQGFGRKPARRAAMLACGGVAVSPGVGMGPVFVAVRKRTCFPSLRGAFLWSSGPCCPAGLRCFCRGGMVSETGGMAGHHSSVAREYRLPTVFSLPNACAADNAGEATLDAGRCAVFAGLNPQLAAHGRSRPTL